MCVRESGVTYAAGHQRLAGSDLGVGRLTRLDGIGVDRHIGIEFG